MFIPEYHKSLETLHFRTEKERAYFIPYDSLEDALSGDRNNSYYLTNLSGDWRFKFFDTFEDVSAETVKADFDVSALPLEKVPGCFQLYDNFKYDNPLYSNLCYPFPTDPPFVPDKNPTALFVKDFAVSDEMLSRDSILTFEGVASCFYLFVNGNFAGYSQISHSTSEFNITEYLKEGENRISVLCVKWCDGSYLEDQDFFRLSGIFREVYILSRNRICISDAEIRQSFSDDYTSAKLSISCTLTKASPILWGIASPGGDVLQSGESNKAEFSIEIKSPLMWNDEMPYVYTLFLTVEDEIIPFQVALCEKKIENKMLLINGRPVKLCGINRHDSSAENGYAVTLDEMKRDLLLLKRANVNAIRTSHYPNDPRFIILGEALGFYFIDEADLETHGMGYNTESDWDWTRWSFLSNSPDWEEAYVDRARHLYERDKNRGAVIMWSLGNESGCGVNHRAMKNYIKSRDKNAIVHYENAHLEFKAVPDGENFSDISDVESRMYAGTGYIEKYLNSEEYTKPFYMCEYVDSISTGDVYDFWKLVDKYDNFSGGCIWEFCDHAVNAPDENGNPRYFYGGDFGDFPNDGICCVDGLVFPDRTPRPGYYDMKKVYEPIRGNFDNGVLTVKSVRYFTPLSDLKLCWALTADGEIIKSGEIDSVDIAPQSEKSYKLFEAGSISLTGDCFVTVSFKTKENKPWAESGYETAFLQFEIAAKKAYIKRATKKVLTENGERFLKICIGENEYTFDKSFGKIISIKRDGTELLKKPAEFSLWHAPTYNRGSLNEWIKNRIDRVTQKTYCTDVAKISENSVTVKTKIALGGPSNPPIIKADVNYYFKNDGTLNITFDGKIRENAPVLPRLGLLLIMNDDNEKIEYFGLGETETYPDRYLSARYGKYSLTVTDNFVHYVRPQENSLHFKTRRVKIGDKASGISVTSENEEFSFNASHYSAEQITNTKHDFELKKEPFTYFNIDYRFNALSESGELNNDENNRLFDEKEVNFSFTLEPTAM